MTFLLAALALLVACAALTLSVMVARQSGAVAATLEKHRRGHAAPAETGRTRAERRETNLGAPRSTGERRAAPGQVLPPEDSWTGPQAAEPPTTFIPRLPSAGALPRPGEIGRPR